MAAHFGGHEGRVTADWRDSQQQGRRERGGSRPARRPNTGRLPFALQKIYVIIKNNALPNHHTPNFPLRTQTVPLSQSLEREKPGQCTLATTSAPQNGGFRPWRANRTIRVSLRPPRMPSSNLPRFGG